MSVMKHHPGSNGNYFRFTSLIGFIYGVIDLWMYTGDEVIMDEEGYLRGECLRPKTYDGWAEVSQ